VRSRDSGMAQCMHRREILLPTVPPAPSSPPAPYHASCRLFRRKPEATQAVAERPALFTMVRNKVQGTMHHAARWRNAGNKRATAVAYTGNKTA